MPSTFRCRKFKQARQLAQHMDAPLDFGRSVGNGLIERQMSCQYLQQDVESRLDRSDPGSLSFGNAGAFGTALNYERRQTISVRNTQTDPALRHCRAARNGVECEQHPVRLERFALPRGKQKAAAPTDQLTDRG